MQPTSLQIEGRSTLPGIGDRPFPAPVPLISPAAHKSIESALKSIFPGPAEETKLVRARRILKEVVKDVSDDELEVFITELQCLLDAWFDAYEKDVFEGLTLMQVLTEV